MSKKLTRGKLIIATNFIFSRDDYDEEGAMHSKSDNIEIMISDKTDEVMKQLFDSLKNIYIKKLGLMSNSEFVFDYVKLLYYNCQKINGNHSGWYLDSDSIKNKQTAINHINKKDNKYLQYVTTVGSNYKEIGKYAERMIIKMHKVLKVNIWWMIKLNLFKFSLEFS